MMTTTTYEFDWDDRKAASNLKKHTVDFNDAMTVFDDALNMTRFDDEHSDDEERWITLGLSKNGTLLLVVHTYLPIDAQHVLVRIISARHPTKREARQYYEA